MTNTASLSGCIPSQHYPTNTAAPRQVFDELGRLEETVKQANVSASSLITDLDPVLRVPNQPAGVSGSAPAVELCQLASCIRNIRWDVEAILTRLDDARSRVEI